MLIGDICLNINSILCLLSSKEMKMYYVEIDGDLIGFYERNGFKVFHINVIDFQNPVLSIYEESQVKQAFESLPKPILIHCGAGEDRTGAAVEIYNCTSSNLI